MLKIFTGAGLGLITLPTEWFGETCTEEDDWPLGYVGIVAHSKAHVIEMLNVLGCSPKTSRRIALDVRVLHALPRPSLTAFLDAGIISLDVPGVYAWHCSEGSCRVMHVQRRGREGAVPIARFFLDTAGNPRAEAITVKEEV